MRSLTLWSLLRHALQEATNRKRFDVYVGLVHKDRRVQLSTPNKQSNSRTEKTERHNSSAVLNFLLNGECDRDHISVVTSAFAKGFVFAVPALKLLVGVFNFIHPGENFQKVPFPPKTRLQFKQVTKPEKKMFCFEIYPDYCGRVLSCEDEK